MKHVLLKIAGAGRSARARVSLLVVSALALAIAALPASALAVEGEATGKSIAEDFTTKLTTMFTEALPVIITFLVLVTGALMIIAFAKSRGKAKSL